MAIDNLISIKIEDSDLQKINQGINLINEALQGKVINLSPEERRQYGSIADRNKSLVEKCKTYMEQDASTLPRTLDKAEFDADYKARYQLEAPLKALLRIVEKITDTKTLLDHDNYQAAVAYYRYIKYLANQNEPGTTSIYQDLRKHYQTRAGKPAQDTAKNTDKA